MSICQWCLSPDVRWRMTRYGALLPFNNKSVPRVKIGDAGWIHRWCRGRLLMFPVTDLQPDELWGVRWVWERHSCFHYEKAHELAIEWGKYSFTDAYRAIMKRELAEVRRRRERSNG